MQPEWLARGAGCRWNQEASSAVTSVFYLSSSDQARDHFKAKVNEVAYIKADSKVSPRVGGGGEEHIVM